MRSLLSRFAIVTGLALFAFGTHESALADVPAALQAAPPINMSDYAAYSAAGSAHVSGLMTMHGGNGQNYPAANVPIYLIPSTVYTQWYVDLHAAEFKSVLQRAPKAYRGGPPDISKPIPFTDMDASVFKTARSVVTNETGRYRFDNVPAGKYLVLTHWPVAVTTSMSSSSGETSERNDGYGDSPTSVSSSNTTTQTNELHALLMFAITKPIDVADGTAVTVRPSPDNGAELFIMKCGLLPCVAAQIDQWLSPEDRQ